VPLAGNRHRRKRIRKRIEDLDARVSELEEPTRAPAFYRGIPTREITRAVGDPEVPDDLIKVETWN
jgi:hypothetical protein